MLYVSCAPGAIYREGGFFEHPATLEALMDPSVTPSDEFTLIAEIFPPYQYAKNEISLLSASEPFKAQLTSSNANLETAFPSGPASILTEIRNAVLYHNVLYTSSDVGFRVIYETYRACDRTHTPLIDWPAAKGGRQLVSSPEFIDMFIGSVGTSNYGHWLVDDLPRAAAITLLAERAAGRRVRIWITAASAVMDAVRVDSLQVMFGAAADFVVVVIPPGVICQFDQLYFVTPPSYHPVIKSPAALTTLSDAFAPSLRSPGGDRIFVNRRRDHGRALTNMEELRPILTARAFTEVDPEGMSFTEQCSVFAAAKVIVGCMGAAMTNCVFAPAGAITAYLAPEGWVEPFYWDLASVRGHRYVACFGPTEAGDRPAHLSSYSIPAGDFVRMLDQILHPEAADVLVPL